MSLENNYKFTKTLSFRLTIWYAGIFTVSCFLAFFMFYIGIHSLTMGRLDEELIEEVEDFTDDLKEEGIGLVQTEIDEEIEQEDENAFFIRIMSRTGEILVSTEMSSWGNIDINYDRLKKQKDKTNYYLQTLSVPGQEYKARIITATIGPEEIAQIGMILKEEEEYLMACRNLFYGLFLFMALLSGLVGWFIARKGLRDIEEVTRTATEISSGSSDKRVEIKNRYEEIIRLGNAFNMMLDRIQVTHKAMRETNDNIAHDLRSPLARIRGIAEMTLIGKKSTEDFNKMTASTIEECDTLIDMINTMLEITEAEAGVNGMKIEEIDLVKLISDACEIFSPMADEKNITLNFTAPDSMNLRGNIKKLQRIVTNLLENAIKYTPDKGTVCISLYEQDGKINIVVEDTGIGISQEELPRIFERFYRCKKSRTKGGIGLGLSLAKAFAVSLGGAITAKSTINKGSTFAVSFPT